MDFWIFRNTLFGCVVSISCLAGGSSCSVCGCVCGEGSVFLDIDNVLIRLLCKNIGFLKTAFLLPKSRGSQLFK